MLRERFPNGYRPVGVVAGVAAAAVPAPVAGGPSVPVPAAAAPAGGPPPAAPAVVAEVAARASG